MRAIWKYDWRWFFRSLYDRTFNTDLLDRAAQVAFYFSFSIFPLLLFLISLFGLVLESTTELRRELYAYLARIMPLPAFRLVESTIDEIATESSGGKLTLGLLITLWSASAGIDSVRSALNSVYRLTETRSWWRLKLESLAMTFLFVVLIVVVLGIVFYGWNLAEAAFAAAGMEITSRFVLGAIQWAALLLVMLFACEVVFNLLPNFSRNRWQWITPGSGVAILLWITLTALFRLYLEYFNTYSRTYGSLGAVIILMLWLYLTGVALLVGGAINAVTTERPHNKTNE